MLKDLPVRTCFNRVEHIDPARQVVTTSDGNEVAYWRLAVCTGAVPSVPPIPGLAEHAVTMWSVADAQELQRRVNAQLKLAARLPDAVQRQEALSVTVCGGGATGIEIVGTIGQLLPKRAAEIGLDPDDLRISLVEGRPADPLRPARGAADEAASASRSSVYGCTPARWSSASPPTEVILDDGTTCPIYRAGLGRWGEGRPTRRAVGVRALDSPDAWSTSDLKAQGFDSAYVLGDVAEFRDPATNRVLPMLAQFAIREARAHRRQHPARARRAATEPYHPHMHGEFVSVGPSWGVGWAWNLQLSGIPAIIMKRLTYVLYWWQVGGVRLAWRRGRELLAMQR